MKLMIKEVFTLTEQFFQAAKVLLRKGVNFLLSGVTKLKSKSSGQMVKQMAHWEKTVTYGKLMQIFNYTI